MMNCKDEFVFKSLSKVEGGSFTNDNGEVINYDTFYRLVCDSNFDGKIKEIRLKFPVSNQLLFDKLKTLQPYTKINIIFNVYMYNNGCRLVPVDIVK